MPPTLMPRDERADMEAVAENVLEIEDLRVSFHTEEGEVRAVDGVSFAIPRGSIVGLVGESGCGKSVTSYSVLRLIQRVTLRQLCHRLGLLNLHQGLRQVLA